MIKDGSWTRAADKGEGQRITGRHEDREFVGVEEKGQEGLGFKRRRKWR